MYQRLLAACFLLALPTASFASAEAIAIPADLDQLARQLAPAHISRGMSPAEVQANCGAPAAQLAPHIWVYWNFKAREDRRGDGYDTALVIFAQNRVDRVKLCDGAPVRAFLARQATAAKTLVAAK